MSGNGRTLGHRGFFANYKGIIVIAVLIGFAGFAANAHQGPDPKPDLQLASIAHKSIVPYAWFPDAVRGVALFTNKSGQVVDGLLVEYEGGLTVEHCVGIGGSMAVLSNGDGVMRLGGSCEPMGTLALEWSVDAARLTRVVWLVGDNEIHEIDLSLPIARLQLDAEKGSVATLGVIASAAGSKSPTGESLVAYTWNWSDGAVTTGYESTRTFSEPGNYDVSLTVRDAEGRTATARASFTIEVVPIAEDF